MASFVDKLKYAVSNVGYNLGLPGAGISLKAGTPYNPSVTPTKVYNDPYAGTGNSITGSNIPKLNLPTSVYNQQSGLNSGNTLGAQNYNPSTGGQGNGGGGNINLTPPSIPNTSDSDAAYLNALRGQFDNNKNDLINQGGSLDESYNLGKTDIENAVADAQKTADNQKADNETQFGQILKNQLKTYQDLGRQRTGTYSALGSLDSSSYGEDQARADQSLAEGRTTTELQKQKANNTIDDSFNSFKKQATSELGRLALSYQDGKNQIASAIANNDLSSAATIAQALTQIRQRAADIQNKIIDFGNTVEGLKATGNTVKTNIGGINGNDYGAAVSQALANLTKSGNSTYVIPQVSYDGQQGFIGNNSSPDDQKKKFAQLLAGSI